jgi:hypothetical protein
MDNPSRIMGVGRGPLEQFAIAPTHGCAAAGN